jgi:hypothetical protein
VVLANNQLFNLSEALGDEGDIREIVGSEF